MLKKHLDKAKERARTHDIECFDHATGKYQVTESIPGSSRSMEQIKLLMVQILNPNSCSVFGEKEPRGEMKI